MRRLATITVITLLAGIAAAGAAVAAPSYEMTVVPASAGGGPTYFRINVATGQVVYISGTQFALTTDATPIPQGDYHLFEAETPDGKSYWLYRMDSQTGRTWFLSSGAWTEVPPPK